MAVGHTKKERVNAAEGMLLRDLNKKRPLWTQTGWVSSWELQWKRKGNRKNAVKWKKWCKDSKWRRNVWISQIERKWRGNMSIKLLKSQLFEQNVQVTDTEWLNKRASRRQEKFNTIFCVDKNKPVRHVQIEKPN